ncbi:MAG: 1,4-alpha-glucan branching protein GlgB [Clostridiales bacterium]|nr:1,4-alpha-glucan branching protein GlgB [Clostridiales bacterium]
MDFYGFYTGQVFDACQYLGAHPGSSGEVFFRTFAPNAAHVSLLYHEKELPMAKTADGNFYEIMLTDTIPGTVYEYRIYRADGRWTDHCDPYGFAMELRPAHRSLVSGRNNYTFHDEKWMQTRTICQDRPLNIYEMHLGSWRRKGSGEWYRYSEIAEPLAEYLTESGYNYVEFLPVSEHPCDESWGYQNTGFFAPTARYGTPDELKQLIDKLHQHNIGVILDFVPVHFALDAYALSNYDGTSLYEYPHSAVGISEWGSCNFMHSRGEVRSFLQSSANYWLEEFHFDGLRMDAISNMIYWQGDRKRGVNGNAVDFLKTMNRGLKERHPNCILIAEDSTDFPGVTLSTDQGGLGFDYKWDLGWMHDTLEYFQLPPECRTEQYHKLTFSMMYFGNERYLLPLSHDEVVHGKATIAQKMNGPYAQKFPQARAMYLYMAVHPGKKLNFMGNEIAQLREWDEKREQDWNLRTYPIHDSFYRFMSELNQIYLTHSALYENDYKENGFTWLDCHQEKKQIYALLRTSSKEKLAAIFNFGNRCQNDYVLPVRQVKKVTLLLHTDWEKYSGTVSENQACFQIMKNEIVCNLAPFSGMLLQLSSEAFP